jgi:hypothetical protein
MIAEARDMIAVIGLEKRLGKVREQLAERIIAGQAVTPQDVADAEQQAQATIKRDFYTPGTRQVVKPAQAGISDDQDFADRGQRLAEHAVWVAHRGLLALPLVGDPAVAERPDAAG